ncbi:hypothetical protein BP6252_12243 [Coleophoma cylindrospora]|uniref:J domain-containing protein n=1 Tax=Coleophoma cylindrospora TaxID=1849047 RepID=A0A3D8QGQ8_9HELO|nr:hypothetical protein BP6252_12243 [Coleophoma cylindrospora]
MPLRSFPLPAQRLRRLFQSSAVQKADSTPNHYETLQIPTNATPADVKKSFYALSKTHHPDRNPDDPQASARFVKISEAYHILGTPAKRQQYDRDFLRTSQVHGGGGDARPSGSYSSSGPAGGRPASGLSRRRTQFRGPPPSFYRNGGWGDHTEKRQAAQEGDAPPTGEAARGMGSAGGMGPGQHPWRDRNDVPHFDREGHFRTQDSIYSKQERRRQSRSERYADIGAPPGMLANFIFVGGVVLFAVFVPTFVFDRMSKKKAKD